MKKIRLIGFIAIITLLQLAYFYNAVLVQAANLTAVKDTLQSSRLSFSGRVKTPTVTGGSTVYIYNAVSGNFTSISTAGLKNGDSLTIGTGTYTVVSILDDTTFTVTPVLLAGDSTDGAAIYFRAKPQQVITFTTPSAVAAGFFQVLIPAAATNFNDSIPDAGGFDFGGGSVTLTPTDTADYTFVGASSAATASGTGSCTSPANYHCFEFHYTGNGAIGANISLAIGTNSYTNNVLAPAPKASRTAATADSYKIYIKNFLNGADPANGVAVDEAQGSVAFIEGVRVTATVDPSITFKIEGTTAGSHCSLTTDVSTTSYSVPFGVLTLDTFRTAAQKITVSTNAASGYSVTAIENERMSNLATSPSYIPNTTCDSGTPCTQSGAGGAWATAAGNPGFGYTMAVVSSTPTVIPVAPSYRRFASLAATEDPVEIMSAAGIASSQAADVCYQIAVDSTQAAGNYENQITYTATASF